MSTYLVTGAAGFIGSALANRLVNEGHEVYTIDNLSTGFKENVPNGVNFIEGNCQDERIYDELYEVSFDAIFHIAGQSSGEISFDDPVYDLQTNTQSTLLLLKLALKTGCQQFIYASTMSVYGDQPDRPVKENADLNPKSFYGVGKLASEYYLDIYQQYGIKSTALRLFNVYGSGQNMENLRQGMVSIFVAQAVRNKHILVKGSKDRFRDFIHIDDVVDAFIAVLNKQNESFQQLNISTQEKTTIESLIRIIKKYIPFNVSVEYKGQTPGDQFGITGSNKRAKEVLGWAPKITLDAGMKEMINWASRL